MNKLLLLALAALLAVTLADDKYTNKYDNVDLDEILNNERLLKKYVECLLADNDSQCPPDGKELRRNLPDALINNCAMCTEKQKNGVRKVVKFLQEHKKEDFQRLLAKWDPNGVHSRTHPALFSD